MTLNVVMAIILRWSAKFSSFGGQLHQTRSHCLRQRQASPFASALKRGRMDYLANRPTV